RQFRVWRRLQRARVGQQQLGAFIVCGQFQRRYDRCLRWQLCSRWDRFRNAAATALLGGLWHGASWTFVCWGALHGLGLCANHWWSARRSRLGRRHSHSVAATFVCWLATYGFICVTWVLFRSQDFLSALTILGKM